MNEEVYDLLHSRHPDQMGEFDVDQIIDATRCVAIQRIEALPSYSDDPFLYLDKSRVLAAIKGEQTKRPRSPMTTGYWDGGRV